MSGSGSIRLTTLQPWARSELTVSAFSGETSPIRQEEGAVLDLDQAPPDLGQYFGIYTMPFTKIVHEWASVVFYTHSSGELAGSSICRADPAHCLSLIRHCQFLEHWHAHSGTVQVHRTFAGSYG